MGSRTTTTTTIVATVGNPPFDQVDAQGCPGEEATHGAARAAEECEEGWWRTSRRRKRRGERGRRTWTERRDDYSNLVHLRAPFSSVPLPLACPIPRAYVRTRRPGRGITTSRLEIILPFHGKTRSHADDPHRLYKPESGSS